MLFLLLLVSSFVRIVDKRMEERIKFLTLVFYDIYLGKILRFLGVNLL